MGLHSFPREERLKKNNAIKAVLDNGVCYKAKSINIYILKSPESAINRAAFICKKALHQNKSVLRNRIRRIIKDAYRRVKHIFPSGHDIVIIGTRISKGAKATEIELEIANVFKKHSKK